MTSAVTPQVKILEAVQQIKRLRGGSQSHLMRASDGNFYVTKFRNNGQHFRVLANEFFASRIGLFLGLPMPEVAVIEVCDWLIEHTPELRMVNAGYETLCSSGLQLASRYVDDPENTVICDYLPENILLKKTSNWKDLAACVVFDKWTGNTDGRQAVFAKSANTRKFRMKLIDQGHCFNCGEWTFPDLALCGVYFRNCVYEHVTGWESFEPVLSRAERMDCNDLWKLAQGMPAIPHAE
ncbi:MAG TPA: HipA family kinase [Candidatus Angelobacter sp.]|jgi:hypothetical protein|nr:HipA family kinase [Candidatus Angelobacter sp.]